MLPLLNICFSKGPSAQYSPLLILSVTPLPACCLQGTTEVRVMHNGLSIIQCMPPEAAPALPWYQRMPWIFVLIALAAAAVLVALAWCGHGVGVRRTACGNRRMNLGMPF